MRWAASSAYSGSRPAFHLSNLTCHGGAVTCQQMSPQANPSRPLRNHREIQRRLTLPRHHGAHPLRNNRRLPRRRSLPMPSPEKPPRISRDCELKTRKSGRRVTVRLGDVSEYLSCQLRNRRHLPRRLSQLHRHGCHPHRHGSHPHRNNRAIPRRLSQPRRHGCHPHRNGGHPFRRHLPSQRNRLEPLSPLPPVWKRATPIAPGTWWSGSTARNPSMRGGSTRSRVRPTCSRR